MDDLFINLCDSVFPFIAHVGLFLRLLGLQLSFGFHQLCVYYVCVALTGLVYVVCVLQAVQLCWGRGEESSVLQQRELLQRSARGLL